MAAAPIPMEAATDFEVVTSAGAVVRTFDDRKRALAFARANFTSYGQLVVEAVERITRRRRVRKFQLPTAA